MITVRTIAETRQAIHEVRRAERSVGFVPTMGALHSGHWSLVAEARDRCDCVVVSIFVNPTQFCPGEDFGSYPRTLEADLAGCQDAGVDLVFTPSAGEMYPESRSSLDMAPPADASRGGLTTVSVRRLTETLCGRFRSGHFDGVTTVVAKLFNIVSPDVAFLGEKDYQQLVVIRRMVRDLDIPVEIVACPTVREPGGLAVSSRNAYLAPEQRTQARSLHRALQDAADAIGRGERDAKRLISRMEQTIAAAGPVTIDHVSIVDPDSLEDLNVVEGPARICLAVRIGQCRLIDNIGVDAPGDRR